MHWKVVFAVIVVCTGNGISGAQSFDPIKFIFKEFGTDSWISKIYEVLTYLYPAFVEEYFDVLTSNPITCSFKECCTDSWIPANYAGLAKTLKERLHGQHLVSDPVVNHLRAHGEENPHKALVLSFHGSTGTGKTYVSRLIAQNLFYKGMESKYVHLFSATKDFRLDDKVLEYSDFLRQKIKESVKKCPRSMFIFDEMHKMPAGIIDTLKPYLDHYEKVDGVDYRRATFIFLSNTGASEIDERTFSDWQNDKLRRSLTLTEMEQLIQDIALNTTNGLRNSDVVLHSLKFKFSGCNSLIFKNYR